MQGIVTFDSLSASQQKKIFELLTSIDEIRPVLYKEVLGELGYSGSDGIKQFERALLDEMIEIQKQNPRLAPDTVYKKGLEKLGISDVVTQLMSKSNQNSLLDALEGRTKFFDMTAAELVKLKTDLFRKMEKNAKYDPKEEDYDLMEELIRRGTFQQREWIKFLERRFANLKEVWTLAEEYRNLKSQNEIPKGTTFDTWVMEKGRKYENVWAKYGNQVNYITRLVSVPLGWSEGATKKQVMAAWYKLGGITLAAPAVWLLQRASYYWSELSDYIDDFTNYDESLIQDRWKEFSKQSEPQFNIGGNKFSVYNPRDFEKNRAYENNAPIIQIYDKENGLLEVLSGISIDGVVRTIVKFLMSQTPFVAGSKFSRDYIGLPTASATPTPEPQSTYTKDIESFKKFLDSKNIDSSNAYYDVEFDMFYDGKGGEYEFNRGSFL